MTNDQTQGSRPSLHLTLFQLQDGLRALPAPPKDAGTLKLIVRRKAPDVHEPLEAVTLTPEQGIPGDKWNEKQPRSPDTQLSVLRHDVAELIANGQPLTTFGDNLLVDLDLSPANLPCGARLRVGEAVVEVTPKPHTACKKFVELYGADAQSFVNAPGARQLNLRGVYWKVVSPGAAKVGSPIQVLSRP